MSDSGGARSLAARLAVTAFSVAAAVAAAWAGMNGLNYARERKAVKEDEKILREITELVPTVKGLAESGFSEERMRKERETGQWTTFFASAASSAGLASNQYGLPAMKTFPDRGFDEHRFEIRINPKTGVTRKALVQLLWTIESRRTYLKTRSFDLRRSGDEDDWGGNVTVAYREKKKK